MDKLSLLKSVFIFSGLENDLIQHLSEQLKQVRFLGGDKIFSEGDISDSFYIVDSGKITIYKQFGPGKEKVLAVFGPVSVFGEMAFFSDSPRTANAKAKSDSVLFKISRNDFREFITSRPEEGLKILSRLLEVVMERLEQTSRELATIYQTSKVISSSKSLGQIIKELQDEVLLAIPEADRAATFVYNEFNMEFDPVAAPEGSKEIAPNHPIIKILKDNPSGIIENNTQDNTFPKDGFLNGSKSFIIVPMLKDNRLMGFSALWNKQKTNAFKNSHCLLLSSVNSQLAEAIENIRHQQEERERKRLEEARQGY